MPASRRREQKERWGTNRQRTRVDENWEPAARKGLTRSQTLILLALVAAFGAAIYYFATRDRSVATASGLRFEVLEQGTGDKPVKGQTVQVSYTGTLKNGEKFDSSEGKPPYEFKLGEGAVIKGWDEAIADMKVGERRKTYYPAQTGLRGQRSAAQNQAQRHALLRRETGKHQEISSK